MSLRMTRNRAPMRVAVVRSMISEVRDMTFSIVHSGPGTTMAFGAKIPSMVVELMGSIGVIWRIINPSKSFVKSMAAWVSFLSSLSTTPSIDPSQQQLQQSDSMDNSS